MKSTNFNEHVVAFIDLLGFKEAIKNDREYQNILNMLYNFKSEINETLNVAKQVIEKDIPNTYGQFVKITIFSDNIVMSYPIDNHNVHEALFFFMAKISELSSIAWEHGFLFRGGIATGLLYHEDDIVFGKALINSYLIESKSAIYPRIIVDNSCLNYLNPIPDFLIRDFDGLYILDYYFHTLLYYFKNTSLNDKARKVKFLKNVIDKHLQRKDDLQIFAKWNYFNSHFIRTINNPIIESLLNSNISNEP